MNKFYINSVMRSGIIELISSIDLQPNKIYPNEIISHPLKSVANDVNHYNHNFSLSDLDKCIDNLPRHTSIYWTDYTENLNNSLFKNFIDLCSSKHLTGELSTTLLGSPESLNALLNRSYFKKINVHIPDIKTILSETSKEIYIKNLRFVLDNVLRPGDSICFVEGVDPQIHDLLSSPDHYFLLNSVSVNEIPLTKINNGKDTANVGDLSIYDKINYTQANNFKNLRFPICIPNGDLIVSTFDYSLSYIIGNLKIDSLVNILNRFLENCKKDLPDDFLICPWAQPISFKDKIKSKLKTIIIN